MHSLIARVFKHWRTTTEGLGFASIAYLLTDHGVQLSFERNDKLIPMLITGAIALLKLFSTDPVNKPAPEKSDPVIGSQVRSFLPALAFLTVLGLSSAAVAQGVVVANAANFRSSVAPGSIAVAFGLDFTTATESAQSLPLPARLANASLLVDRTFTGLFFVSPRQINFLVPDGLAPGLHSIVVVTPDGRNIPGTFFVGAAAPGVFTVFANGNGEAAANYLRFGNQGCIVLWATGVTTNRVSLIFGGRSIPASFAGNAPGFAGLQQLNFLAPIGDLPTAPTNAFIRACTGATSCSDS